MFSDFRHRKGLWLLTSFFQTSFLLFHWVLTVQRLSTALRGIVPTDRRAPPQGPSSGQHLVPESFVMCAW